MNKVRINRVRSSLNKIWLLVSIFSYHILNACLLYNSTGADHSMDFGWQQLCVVHAQGARPKEDSVRWQLARNHDRQRLGAHYEWAVRLCCVCRHWYWQVEVSDRLGPRHFFTPAEFHEVYWNLYQNFRCFFHLNMLLAGGTQKINLLHKAGGRVVSFGKRYQRKVDKIFFLSSTKSWKG